MYWYTHTHTHTLDIHSYIRDYEDICIEYIQVHIYIYIYTYIEREGDLDSVYMGDACPC